MRVNRTGRDARSVHSPKLLYEMRGPICRPELPEASNGDEEALLWLLPLPCPLMQVGQRPVPREANQC